MVFFKTLILNSAMGQKLKNNLKLVSRQSSSVMSLSDTWRL